VFLCKSEWFCGDLFVMTSVPGHETLQEVNETRLLEQAGIKPIWHRLEQETNKQWAAFCIYVRLPLVQRNVSAAYRLYAEENGREPLQTVPQNIWDWAKNNNWHERARALDGFCTYIYNMQHQDRIAEMAQRHQRIGQAMMDKAAKAMEDMPEDDLEPKDVRGWTETGSKVERQASGVGETSTVVVDTRGQTLRDILKDRKKKSD
jgi:hypothetical protein